MCGDRKQGCVLVLCGKVRFVRGALHLLNCCSLRYTSKGPVVFAIFLLWPRDSVLCLSSPIPSPGTQVRDLEQDSTH